MKKEKYEEIIYFLKTIIENTEWEDKVFSVGGCIRDLLLGNEIKDIDLVIEKSEGGINFSKWLYLKGFLISEPVLYPTYGTSMFKLSEFPDYPLEAVCTRKERYLDHDTRNPETAFGSLEEDCFRRDLTINSLYQNISTLEIIDLAKGQTDLKNKIIRTTSEPEMIFEDDPLRILRVIRFWGRLGKDWKIDEKILVGIEKLSNRLTILSRERVSSELVQILCCSNASDCLRLMENLGILKVILPSISRLAGCKQGPQHFGDVFEHTLAVIDKVRPIQILRLAALFHDSGKPDCITYKEGIPKFYRHEIYSANISLDALKSLAMSNEVKDLVYFLITFHMIFKQCGNKGEKLKSKKLRKYMNSWGEDKMNLLLELIDADNKSHSEEYCLPDQVNEIRNKINQEKEWFNYSLPVTGKDIMEIKNISPGPLVKSYKTYLLNFAYSHPNLSGRDALLEELKHVKQNNLPK